MHSTSDGGTSRFAGFEYALHYDADSARKREAATTILARSFDNTYVDEALGKLHRKYDRSHIASKAEDDSDDNTEYLMSYFSSIDACVRNDLCSLATVLNIYCQNYRSYISAYSRAHGIEKTEDEFGRLASLNQCFPQREGTTVAPAAPLLEVPVSRIHSAICTAR